MSKLGLTFDVICISRAISRNYESEGGIHKGLEDEFIFLEKGILKPTFKDCDKNFPDLKFPDLSSDDMDVNK